jgi:hypothetical protein
MRKRRTSFSSGYRERRMNQKQAYLLSALLTLLLLLGIAIIRPV